MAVAAAFVVRTAVRLSRDEGFTDSNSRVIMADAVVTALTAGMNAAFKAGSESIDWKSVIKNRDWPGAATGLGYKVAKYVATAPYIFSNHFYNKQRELW